MSSWRGQEQLYVLLLLRTGIAETLWEAEQLVACVRGIDMACNMKLSN